MSDILHEDFGTFRCFQSHKFAEKKSFLCNTQYCYIAGGGLYLYNTHRTHCCNNSYQNALHCYLIGARTSPLVINQLEFDIRK
jgi:hypothetical protein